jgi:ABC-type multidrug transport system fused ATPase/permease subunit
VTKSPATGTVPGLPRRVATRLLHELREALPPTIFFFVGFNFIVLTTNLLVADYAVAVSNFMLATVAALVVGKAVLTANAMPFIKLFDRAPLIRSILFKTVVYWVAVFLARLMERFVHFSLIEGNWPGDFGAYLITTFSWPRFVAISLWIFVLFLIYVTAFEFSQRFGATEMRRILFTHRPSELQLNRRQRARELLRLSRIADEHSVDEFRDTTSAAHHELVEIVQRLARASRLKATR